MHHKHKKAHKNKAPKAEEKDLTSFQEDFNENKIEETPSLFIELQKKTKKTKKTKKGKKGKKAKVIPADNPDMILQPKEKLDILMTDYMLISSPQFKNTKKFPPLQLPDGKTVKIKIDEGYYRINDFSKGPNAPPSNKHFWFRMSGRNLYYSTNKDDINVLGSIRIKSISDVEPKKIYDDDKNCFKVLDVNSDKWKLCPPDLKRKKEWICAIRKVLNIFDEDCRKTILADAEITVLTKKVTQPIILVSQPNRVCNDEWDYSKGGSDWECTCKEGKEQSPIDLPKKDDAIPSPAKPLFQYDEVPTKRIVTTKEGLSKTQRLRITYEDTKLKIKDSDFGKVVTLDGSVFLATEINFHTPSEHKINGKTFPMEMQIIHEGQTKGDIGKQVILSFLFEKKPGAYNKFIDDVDFFNLPNPTNKNRDIVHDLYIPKIFYSSNDEDIPIMKEFSFYTYQGSITTPPCTERTIHYVASKPIPLGSTALTLFKEATRIPDMMDSSGNVIVNTNPSGNSRKTQPLNGRKVFHYSHKEPCKSMGVVKNHKKKKEGHYEKVVKKATQYFYVNNEVPSRLPGAIVVSESEAKGYE
jgi:carbonic anhydrase